MKKEYNTNIKTVVVLCMHRSGSSMTSGILSMLDVEMGETIDDKSIFNVKGYFENYDFVNLNKQILKESNGSWDNPPERDLIIKNQEKFRAKIQKLLKTKNNGIIWGWKDPRTILTIDLYLPYLINPFFIVCYRDNTAIAKSLLNRNSLNIEQGVALSQYYNKLIKQFINKNNGIQLLEMQYEETRSKPIEAAEKIAKFLSIQINNSQKKEIKKNVLKKNKLQFYKFLFNLKRKIIR